MLPMSAAIEAKPREGFVTHYHGIDANGDQYEARFQ